MIHIKYRQLNTKGTEEYKNIEAAKQESNTQQGSRFQYIPGRIFAHLRDWILDFPALVRDTALCLFHNNAETKEHLKRQAWNTFIARPIEIVAALASPIDEVGYRNLCLKLDYDYYLPENEQPTELASQIVKNEGDSLVIVAKDLDNPRVDSEKVWELAKKDLECNGSLQNINLVIGEGQELVIPREVALKANKLSPKELIIASSPMEREQIPKELLKHPKITENMLRYLYMQPAPELKYSDKYVVESFLIQLGIMENPEI